MEKLTSIRDAGEFLSSGIIVRVEFYFTRRENRLIVLLVGGDKPSQAADILKARKLAKELK
jgi:putative addiction module killer protein